MRAGRSNLDKRRLALKALFKCLFQVYTDNFLGRKVSGLPIASDLFAFIS